MNIGQIIRFVRLFRGMKLEKLEKNQFRRWRNRRTRMSRYKNRKRTPKEGLLVKISDALQIDFGFSIKIIEHDGKLLLDLNNLLFSDFLLQ